MKEEYKIVISEERIRERVRELADRISRDYAGQELLVVGVLRGAFIFLADLIRVLRIPVRVDFIHVSSYGDSARSSGTVTPIRELTEDIRGRHILIVEDILDSGLTLKSLSEALLLREPASLRIAALIVKAIDRPFPLLADYVGFEMGDQFLVGYGLDYSGRYRELPFVAEIEVEI